MFDIQFPAWPSAARVTAGDIVKSVKRQKYGTGFDTTFILVNALDYVPMVDSDEPDRVLSCTVLRRTDTYNSTWLLDTVVKSSTDEMFEGIGETDQQEALEAFMSAMREAEAALREAEYKRDAAAALADKYARLLYSLPV